MVLVQAQDPANDPNLFFDPNGAKTVQRGSQANTAPFGGAAAPAPAPAPAPDAGANQPPVSLPAEGNPAPTTPPVATPPAAGVDFGSCQTPEIEFGPAFDGRRETSFRPVAGKGFNQGSAQNINIITRAMCDQLTNTCRANQAAKDLCAQAQTAAANAAPAKTGIQADAFNAVFGITTNFADDTVIDDQGRIVSGGSNNGGAAPATPPTNAAPAAPATPAPATPGGNTGNTGAGSDFGSCTTPEIRFAAGIDGRRETSFEPADKASFNHGSAQNIGIITQFICDTLTNTCGANQQAKDVCQQARAAAAAAQVGSGAQADAFNAVFGIQTNFVNVQQIDNQGRVVGGGQAQQPQNNTGNTGNNGGNTGNNGGNAGGNTGGNAQPAPQTPPAQGNNGGNNAGNVQAFAGQLGGVRAPTVIANGNAFQVEGNASFNNLRSALVRSCDVQNNQCANAANASGNQNGFNVAACNAQQAQCIQQANAQAN